MFARLLLKGCHVSDILLELDYFSWFPNPIHFICNKFMNMDVCVSYRLYIFSPVLVFRRKKKLAPLIQTYIFFSREKVGGLKWLSWHLNVANLFELTSTALNILGVFTSVLPMALNKELPGLEQRVQQVFQFHGCYIRRNSSARRHETSQRNIAKLKTKRSSALASTPST